MSLQAYAYVHVAAFKLSRKPRCVLDAVSTLSFCALDAISSYLENTTINHLNYCWQTSKRFWLAAHFLSISNTQVGRNTKEQKLQKDVRLCGSVVWWKWQEMSSLLGWKVQHGICSSWFCVKCHMHLFINSNSLDLCILIIHTWRRVWEKRMLGAEMFIYLQNRSTIFAVHVQGASICICSFIAHYIGLRIWPKSHIPIKTSIVPITI